MLKVKWFSKNLLIKIDCLTSTARQLLAIIGHGIITTKLYFRTNKQRKIFTWLQIMWDKPTTDVRMNAKICLVNQDLHENIFLVDNWSVRIVYFLAIFASYEINAFTKMSLNIS